MGALAVELPDGTGFSDAQRENPPPIGGLITFRYQELSDRGVPRFPSFVRVRQEAAAAAERRNGRRRQAKQVVGQARQPAGQGRGVACLERSPPTAGENQPTVRHFELVEGKSAKFWEISAAGCQVTVRFGRIGAEGQTQTKTFADAAAAARHVQKLIDEKTSKGYVESRPSSECRRAMATMQHGGERPGRVPHVAT